MAGVAMRGAGRTFLKSERVAPNCCAAASKLSKRELFVVECRVREVDVLRADALRWVRFAAWNRELHREHARHARHASRLRKERERELSVEGSGRGGSSVLRSSKHWNDGGGAVARNPGQKTGQVSSPRYVSSVLI